MVSTLVLLLLILLLYHKLSKSEYITFGTTVVNLAAVVSMSEDEFKSMLKGVITTDINDAWKEVIKHKPKEVKQSQPKRPRKRYSKSED